MFCMVNNLDEVEYFCFLKVDLLWIFELLDRKSFTWIGLKFIWEIDDLVEVAPSLADVAQKTKEEKEKRRREGKS